MVHLPKWVEVESLPKNIAHQTGFMTFSRTFSKTDDVLTVVDEKIQMPARIQNSRYSEVRESVRDLAKLTEEKVILKGIPKR